MKALIIFNTLLFSLGLMSHLDSSVPTFTPKEKLSDYQFFTGTLSALNPAPALIPYELNSSLFSNYAEKLRFIVLPGGSHMNYDSTQPFDLPIGTVLIKNFYYPLDFSNPGKGRKLIETRLLVHETTGWNALPYIWNDEQTDAFYDVAGDTRTITYLDNKGKKQTTNYVIPNKNQCKGCHTNGKEFLPIGISARHLNKTVRFSGIQGNQLKEWANKGWLKGLPADGIPANADWENTTASLDARARSYLDINCGHCHNAAGPANTSGLFLDIHNQDPHLLGIHKTPIAAGRGSGTLSYAIVPGKPEKSILVYRMNTNDPGIAMPELGREQIHREGVALISNWIRSLQTP